MSSKTPSKILLRLSRRRRDAYIWEQALWIAQADPYTQWREINERVDKIMPLLDPLTEPLPDPKVGWQKVLDRYEEQKRTWAEMT